MNNEELKEAERLLREHQAEEAWKRRQDFALSWWQQHCKDVRDMFQKMTDVVDAAYEEGVKEGRRLAALEHDPEPPQ